MASGAACHFYSSPVILIATLVCVLSLVLFTHTPAMPLHAPQGQANLLIKEKSCADSTPSSARHGFELKWFPISIDSYVAGQIDVSLALLLLVAWGIASVRIHGRHREE